MLAVAAASRDLAAILSDEATLSPELITRVGYRWQNIGSSLDERNINHDSHSLDFVSHPNDTISGRAPPNNSFEDYCARSAASRVMRSACQRTPNSPMNFAESGKSFLYRTSHKMRRTSASILTRDQGSPGAGAGKVATRCQIN